MSPIVYVYPFTESFIDYPDDCSLCLSIYFLGCDHHCVDCSNPKLQNKENLNDTSFRRTFKIGEFVQTIKNECYTSKVDKLTFLGGDCLHPDNINNTKRLLVNLKNHVDICIYTGYEIEYVKENEVEGFTFLKTGRYLEEYKQESIKTDEYLQFASSNQQLYDSDYTLLSQDGRYYF